MDDAEKLNTTFTFGGIDANKENRETAEIAKLVGRPPATVNSQLWRAKLLLRQQITERRQKE